MFRAPHFVTGEFEPHHAFLDDETYGKALDSLVKACSDVMIESADGSKVFLGRRKVEPQPDWWFVGGRARPGDTTQEAAARNVRRELGLVVEAARFEVVASYSFAWRMRQQAPRENGTADISTVHTLRLTAEEADAVQLDPDEYVESRWIALDEILAGDFHPALKQAAADLQAMRAFRRLQAAVATDGTDAEVAAAARALVNHHGAGTCEGAKVIFDAAAGTYEFRERGKAEGGGDE